MKIGISMDVYFGTLDPCDSIVKLKELGFDALDFNLSDYCYSDFPLAMDTWESWLYKLKETAEKYNISFSQVHELVFKSMVCIFLRKYICCLHEVYLP